MPSNFSTANRMYFLTPEDYGEDDLLIEEMRGTEGLSQLFHFQFRLLSYRDDISPHKMIGKSAILRIETATLDHQGGERHWSGYISAFSQTGRSPSADGEDLYTYECELVPWLWFFTRHRDNRIFQNLSIPDIVEKLLRDAGFMDYTLELREQHPPLEYVTQFRETNLDFMNRLLERAGIYTYYRHDEGRKDAKHKLILTDHVDANPTLEPDYIPFHHAGWAEEGHDAITTLRGNFSMRTGGVATRDWDFRGKRVLPADTPTNLRIGGNEAWEHYDYPGQFDETDLGEHYTKVAMQAEEASYLTLSGTSQARQLIPGFRFRLEDHLLDAFNREYLVVSVSHQGRNNLTTESGPSTYSNSFTVQPHDVPFRAPLHTPRPRMYGPQTAIVSGPQGDEIHTDEYGRIKVQFHWDRQGEYNDKSSCWMRVAQTWAGNGYGTMFIPRVGMEVVVDFLDGDPDQPIVTGCVYNGVNKVPYALPADATRSTIKTLSSKGGGGTNELRFEDKKGSEEIFVHAERDLQRRVKRNSSESVGGSVSETVGGDKSTSISGNRSHTCTEYKSTADKIEHLSTTHSLASGTLSFKAEPKTSKNAAGLGDFKVEAMNTSTKADLQVLLDAGATLSLKCGGSSIMMTPASIMIQAPLVTINSGGSGLMGKLAELAGKALDAAEAIVGKVADLILGTKQKALSRFLKGASKVARVIGLVKRAAGRVEQRAIETATKAADAAGRAIAKGVGRAQDAGRALGGGGGAGGWGGSGGDFGGGGASGAF